MRFLRVKFLFGLVLAFIQQPALSLPTHKTGGALIAPPEVYSGQNARTLELATEFKEIAKIVK